MFTLCSFSTFFHLAPHAVVAKTASNQSRDGAFTGLANSPAIRGGLS